MSEELTIKDLDVATLDADIAWWKKHKTMNHARMLPVLEAARAHLSRPVVGDEQMRNALTIADEHKDDEYYCDAACEEWTELALVSRALLAMSEQLAAEQAKVKALQPYKDAYDAGQDMFAIFRDENQKILRVETKEPTCPWPDYYTMSSVRVCKPVKGDG